MRPAARGAIVLAFLTGGCAENAIFELTIKLPPAEEGGAQFARVQARRAANHEFAVPWASSDDPAAIALEPDGSAVFQTSLIATDENTDVHVKVLFCEDTECDGTDSALPTTAIVFEHPFYEGKYTSYEYDLDEVPTTTAEETEPITIDKCSIAGCIAVSEASGANYCYELGANAGKHMCEDE